MCHAYKRCAIWYCNSFPVIVKQIKVTEQFIFSANFVLKLFQDDGLNCKTTSGNVS